MTTVDIGAQVIRATCPHDCPDTCAMLVTVEDGRATKVVGDPDHPVTRGFLCTKVSRYVERTYHAGRVLYPHRRVGPKGSGQFERISWDEAFSRIAKLMKADRDANFIEKNEQGVTVNRWTSTGMLCASAASNETGMLTQKFVRSLGMLAVDNQARV